MYKKNERMNNIWVIGAGLMGVEYAKVLSGLGHPFITIGRGLKNADEFEKSTGYKAITGGIEEFLKTNPVMPEAAIVAVGIEALAEVTIQLLNFGIQKILLEKPGVGDPAEITALADLAEKKRATVLLAYNRRFYSSVLKAEEIIKQDGGVHSFCFEFTEWSHIIVQLTKTKVEHNFWFLGNSTHVIDTAFLLGGKPKILHALHKGGLDWHPASSVFAGAGESESGALFSYHADWEAPGRWVIEILTKKNRLLFKPMESLQIQQLGSVAVNPVDIDDQLDKDFKPGLYLQTKAFIENDFSRFCTLCEQKDMIEKYYCMMSGYNSVTLTQNQ
jgi:predicted dehydrogenase